MRPLLLLSVDSAHGKGNDSRPEVGGARSEAALGELSANGFRAKRRAARGRGVGQRVGRELRRGRRRERGGIVDAEEDGGHLDANRPNCGRQGDEDWDGARAGTASAIEQRHPGDA